MRRSGKWMVLLDERILELFEESDKEYMSPSDITSDKRIDYSSPYVSQRCKKLAEHGLLQAVGNGIYTITDSGRAYLEGEYNAAERSDIEAGEQQEEEGVGEQNGV